MVNPFIRSFGRDQVINKFLSIFMLLSLVSAADLEWQAEFRYRLETGKSDSLFYKKANTINYTRSRISLKFINGPIMALAQLQDSRILGRYYNSPGITQASGLKIEFHQIYFQVNNLLKRNWTMRFGRFEMPLGSKRLFSNNNWSNYGRAFEGITSFNQNKFGSLNTFYLINDENSKYSDSDEYDAIIRGFYLSPFLKHIPFVKINQLDFYLYNYIYNELDIHDRLFTEDRDTFGTRWIFSFLFAQFEGEYAFQSGKNKGSYYSSKISSYMNVLNFHFDLSFIPVLSRLSFGKEYFSGDDPSTTIDLEGFANPWGEDHKYHGYFDKHTRFNNNYSDGLDEWNVKAEFSLRGGVKLNVHYHDFKDGIKSDPLGTELDIVFSKKLGFGGVLQQGFARYWEEGGDQLDTGWFMLTFIL